MEISSFTAPLGAIDDVARDLVRLVCPLFVLTGPGRPFLIGTGTPVQIGRVSVIVTAAHVLRPYGNASVLTLGVDRAVDLTGEKRGFGYLPGQTADPDLALIVLNDEERSQVRLHYEMSYFQSSGSPHRSRNGAFYVVAGYPQSQNKMSPRLMRSNRAVGNYYITRHRVPVADLRLEGKYDAVHFALSAPPKGAIRNDGRRVSFPSPAGLSGGGVWRLEIGRSAAAAPKPRLVGILIEHHKQPGVFVCTRVREVERMVLDLA
jgi:hypothetical protein